MKHFFSTFKSTITQLSILLFIILALSPAGIMILRSFFIEGHLSFINYSSFLSDSRQIHLLLKSVGIGFTSAVISLLIGLPYTLIVNRTDSSGKFIWKWIYLLPICIPPYIYALSWIVIFGTKGPLNSFINIYSLLGTILILSICYFPFVVVLCATGLNSIDKDIEEAASMNSPPIFVLYRITLPLIKPFIISSSIFVFIFSFFNYGVPALLRVHTYPIEIFTQFSAFFDEGKAVALSLPIVILSMGLLYLHKHYMGDKSYISFNTRNKSKNLIQLTGLKKYLSYFFLTIVSLIIMLPIVALVFQSKNLESYKIALKTSSSPLITTIITSLSAATIIIIFSWILSKTIENKNFKFNNFLDYLTFIPIGFPAILTGISLIYFWNRPTTQIIYTSFIILIIGYLIRFIPFSIRIITSGLKQIDKSFTDAALLIEKRWWVRLLKIELPLAIKSLLIAWLLVFIFCMSELGTTLIIIPPGHGTLSLKIYTLMHYGASSIVAALSIMLISLNLIVSGCIFFIIHKKAMH